MIQIPDGPWSVSQGTYDDKPLIARVNTGARAIARDPALAHRVGVAVPFREPNEAGMPSPSESAQLDTIEDALCAAFECGRRSVHVVTLTMQGFREFVFHTSNPEAIPMAVATVRLQHPNHEIQFIQEHDPDWDVYDQVVA